MTVKDRESIITKTTTKTTKSVSASPINWVDRLHEWTMRLRRVHVVYIILFIQADESAV